MECADEGGGEGDGREGVGKRYCEEEHMSTVELYSESPTDEAASE